MSKTQKELGLQGGPEPLGDLRTDRGEAWLKKQPAALQRRVLGVKGQALYEAGKVTLSDFVGLHDGGVWGKSFVVRPLKALGQDTLDIVKAGKVKAADVAVKKAAEIADIKAQAAALQAQKSALEAQKAAADAAAKAALQVDAQKYYTEAKQQWLDAGYSNVYAQKKAKAAKDHYLTSGGTKLPAPGPSPAKLAAEQAAKEAAEKVAKAQAALTAKLDTITTEASTENVAYLKAKHAALDAGKTPAEALAIANDAKAEWNLKEMKLQDEIEDIVDKAPDELTVAQEAAEVALNAGKPPAIAVKYGSDAVNDWKAKQAKKAPPAPALPDPDAYYQEMKTAYEAAGYAKVTAQKKAKAAQKALQDQGIVTPKPAAKASQSPAKASGAPQATPGIPAASPGTTAASKTLVSQGPGKVFQGQSWNQAADVDAWADANEAAWASGLTAAEKAAIKVYRKPKDYYAMNHLARFGKLPSPNKSTLTLAQVQKAVDDLDTALGKGKLSEDVTAWRATTLHPDHVKAFKDGKLAGQDGGDRAFVSTTLNPKYAEKFYKDRVAQGQDVYLVEYRLPKGMRGAYIDQSLKGSGWTEFEYLVPRGAKWRYTDAYTDAAGVKRVRAELIVEDVPPIVIPKGAKKLPVGKAPAGTLHPDALDELSQEVLNKYYSGDVFFEDSANAIAADALDNWKKTGKYGKLDPNNFGALADLDANLTPPKLVTKKAPAGQLHPDAQTDLAAEIVLKLFGGDASNAALATDIAKDALDNWKKTGKYGTVDSSAYGLPFDVKLDGKVSLPKLVTGKAPAAKKTTGPVDYVTPDQPTLLAEAKARLKANKTYGSRPMASSDTHLAWGRRVWKELGAYMATKSSVYRAVRSFKSNGYEKINTYLWNRPKYTREYGHNADTTKRVEREIREIDDAFDHPNARLPEDLVLWRKESDRSDLRQEFASGRLVPGVIYHHDNFWSTAVNDDVWAGDVWFKLHVPKGSRGFYIDVGVNTSEKEVLINRGSRYVVRKVYESPGGYYGTGKRLNIEIEMIHDGYGGGMV